MQDYREIVLSECLETDLYCFKNILVNNFKYISELDDPSLVTTAQPYKGQFPLEDNPTLSEKLNHAHNKYRAILENTLAGKL